MAVNNIKVLYQFTVPFVQEVDEVETSKDKDGNEVKTTRKVKKEIPRAICLKRPTRVEVDASIVYYSVQVNEGLKMGMISKPLLGKLYDNDGGILSRPELDRQNDLWIEFYKKNDEYQRYYGKPNKTPDEQKLIETLIRDMMDIRRRLQDFEMMQSSVFDITAESRARSRTIIWWLLHLAQFDADYEKNIDKTPEEATYNWQPLFPGRDFEQRQSYRDTIEEGDGLNNDEKIFYFRAIQRAAGATAFWHYGRATTQAEFEALEHEFNLDLIKNENQKEESVPLVEESFSQPQIVDAPPSDEEVHRIKKKAANQHSEKEYKKEPKGKK